MERLILHEWRLQVLVYLAQSEIKVFEVTLSHLSMHRIEECQLSNFKAIGVFKFV